MGSIARAFRGVGLGFRADKASELEGVFSKLTQEHFSLELPGMIVSIVYIGSTC